MKKIFSFFLLIFLLTILTSCDKTIMEKITEKTRNITMDDFTYESNISTSSYRLFITPKVNIETITITLELYNSKNEIIKSKNITQQNLLTNGVYQFEIEFDFIEMFRIDHASWQITHGKVQEPIYT